MSVVTFTIILLIAYLVGLKFLSYFAHRISASIVGSATLCFSRWIQRRGRQLH